MERNTLLPIGLIRRMNRVLACGLILALAACSKDDENAGPRLTKNHIDLQLTELSSGLADIDFLDTSTGFAIDTRGRILSTGNSGVDWQELYTSGYELVDIQFTSRQHGYVLARIPEEQVYFLLKTTDSGMTFQEAPIPGGSDLRRVYFIEEGVGFVLGNHILKTTDGGARWRESDLDFNVWNDLVEAGNGDLYACGLRGAFLRSTDSGDSWERINLETSSHLYRIHPFQDLFYFLGQKIVKTDLGETQEYEVPAYINDLHVYREERVLVGFGEKYPELGYFPDGALFISNNSGKDWEMTLLSGLHSISKVDFVDPNNGFGIGSLGGSNNEKKFFIRIKID